MLASELLHILAVIPSHGVTYPQLQPDTLANVLTKHLCRANYFFLK